MPLQNSVPSQPVQVSQELGKKTELLSLKLAKKVALLAFLHHPTTCIGIGRDTRVILTQGCRTTFIQKGGFLGS
jgi:hypothetical protein